MDKDGQPHISIILPCLNEERGVAACLGHLRGAIRDRGYRAEVIVVDNGSTDGSLGIARGMEGDFPGLRVVEEARRGYGSALLAGIAEARGRYVYMADADGTYDFDHIPDFISKLESGHDLVVGNRFSGSMDARAMPFHRRCIGNPLLSKAVRLLFKVPIGDIHCGARAFSRETADKLGLRADGMEFASEMLIQAARHGLAIAEIPIRYRARIGRSKLRPLRDGWRHVRLIARSARSRSPSARP